MTDQKRIEDLLQQLETAGENNDHPAVKHHFTALMNAIPANEVQDDAVRINIRQVAAVLDTNHDGTFSSTEVADFVNRPEKLDETLENTSFVGKQFKIVTAMALADKEEVCNANSIFYGVARFAGQRLFNYMSDASPEEVNALAKQALYLNLNEEHLTPDGRMNADTLSAKSAELFKSFQSVEIPTQEEICGPVETPPAQKRWRERD